MLVNNFGTAFRIAPGTPRHWFHQNLHCPGIEHSEQTDAKQNEHRVQRLGRKDGREGQLGESQKGPRREGGGVVKGTGTYGSALAADRGGRFDFWNLALYKVILKRCSPYFVQCGGWGYMTQDGVKGDG